MRPRVRIVGAVVISVAALGPTACGSTDNGNSDNGGGTSSGASSSGSGSGSSGSGSTSSGGASSGNSSSGNGASSSSGSTSDGGSSGKDGGSSGASSGSSSDGGSSSSGGSSSGSASSSGSSGSSGGSSSGSGSSGSSSGGGADAGSDARVDSGSGIDAGAWDAGPVVSGTWQPLKNQPTFTTDFALLLTDGRVMIHSNDSWGDFWSLTPDQNGSYVNATWTKLASLPSGYTPLDVASAVLPDGRVLVEGGEYQPQTATNPSDTNLGAIYDPLQNKWTSVSPPSGWSTIGDAQSVVLANGTLMIGNVSTNQAALFNATTLTWTATGTGKADPDSEEGWTLLPNGKVLTVDTGRTPQSEIYDPSTGAWTNAGSTIVTLPNSVLEIGPAVLMPNGKVFAAGASKNTAIYDTSTGTWSTGPTFPTAASGQLVMEDAPASLMPNGRVLLAVGPSFNQDVHFLEFDGTSLTEVARTPNAPNDAGFYIGLLVLPTGQVLETDRGSRQVEVYTPSGGPNPAWTPAITSVPSSLTRGSTYTIQGTQFNGLSQCNAFGDDVQNATNYPLVQIINVATGHVFYARTHGHSTMAVATGSQVVSTSFDVPAAAETGASNVVVVVNGITSAPMAATVQ